MPIDHVAALVFFFSLLNNTGHFVCVKVNEFCAPPERNF
jgi:hypothetical protein